MRTKVLSGSAGFKDVKQNEIVVSFENNDTPSMIFQCLWSIIEQCLEEILGKGQ